MPARITAFCPPDALLEASASGTLFLDARESRHVVSVLRARPGQTIQLIDGTGTRGEARLTEADPRSASLELTGVAQVPEPDQPLWIAVGLPKGKAFDAIIRGLTELGVAACIPLITEHTEARPDTPDRARTKAGKWRATAIEACKQSGNPRLPVIPEPVPLINWLQDTPQAPVKWVASLAATTAPADPPRPASAHGLRLGLVGPEGDFSDAEYRAIAEAGFTPLSLGPHILRTETAAQALAVRLTAGI
ncbi:MAG: RsmE family RNA methyltransferase [Opitutales bacterium]